MNDDELSDIRLKYLGFIFQSFNLIPQLSVEENIALPLYYLGWSTQKRLERARELGEMVGLKARMNHKPSELSGGQQQRVAIARALSNDPVFLLADEPTGNLDTATSIEIIELLKQLNNEGKTIIMVTHEPAHLLAHYRASFEITSGATMKKAFLTALLLPFVLFAQTMTESAHHIEICARLQAAQRKSAPSSRPPHIGKCPSPPHRL